MRKIFRLRVNGWMFFAFIFLYAAIMFITAFFSTLQIIGICYSSVTEITEDGQRLAHYEYEVDDRVYSYAVDIENTAEFLVPQIETVFYFKEYPSVRTGSLELFIYPAIVAACSLCFALIFRHGTDELTEDSPQLGIYIVPILFSIVSLFPVCSNVWEVCGLYTSVMSAFENAQESVYSLAKSLGYINLNLLLWGVWAKIAERRKAGNGKKTADTKAQRHSFLANSHIDKM